MPTWAELEGALSLLDSGRSWSCKEKRGEPAQSSPQYLRFGWFGCSLDATTDAIRKFPVWVRPILTISFHSCAFAVIASRSAATAGMRRAFTLTAAAMYI